MLVRMTAYYRRKDRKALLVGRDDVETTINRTADVAPVVTEPVEEG